VIHHGFQQKPELEAMIKSKAKFSQVSRQVFAVHAVISAYESACDVADDGIDARRSE